MPRRTPHPRVTNAGCDLTLPPRLRLTARQAAVYTALLLWVAFEVARSVQRAELVVFSGYVTLGNAVLQGADPYSARFTDYPPLNTWPPFFGFVAAALALLARLSLPGALLLWQLGSVWALWGAIRLLARFFEEGGDRLTFFPSATTPDQLSFVSAAVLVPVLLSARLLQEHLQHTQVNILLLFLVLFAFHRFRTGREAAGGLSLALAASLKAVPILFVPYLVYKRAWRAAAWTVGFLLILNVVLPAAAFGPEPAARQWGAWRALSGRELAQPTPHHYNQSLLAALKRLLTAEGGARDPVRYAVAAWPTARATQLFAVVAVLGALGLAVAFRRHPPGLRDRSAAAELAICLPASTLVTPLAWKAHFVTLLAGYWFVWWALGRLPPGKSRRWRLGLLWLSVGLLTLSAPALVGKRATGVLESLNAITLGALIVVGLGVSLLSPLRRQTPASSAAPTRP
ncbi:MAG TPA: glycosyltransferase family 87 protein [Gemmatimonadales bacterium]|nr:glycosyltransferase family 87 protein [Gemmatimonadales bacterium]